jgi:hypothetical protein
MAQTFDATSEYGEPNEGAGRNTSSTPTQSASGKVIGNTPEAKKLRVHTKDPNNSTPNKSRTPTA